MIKNLREDGSFDEISCWLQIWFNYENDADSLLELLKSYNTEKDFFIKKNIYVIRVNELDVLDNSTILNLISIIKNNNAHYQKIKLEVSNRTNFGESEVKVPFVMTLLSYNLNIELSFSVL